MNQAAANNRSMNIFGKEDNKLDSLNRIKIRQRLNYLKSLIYINLQQLSRMMLFLTNSAFKLESHH